MSTLFYNISQALGLTILHSLWQGMVVYLALRILLAALPSLAPVKKYNLAIIAMGTVLAGFSCTLYAEMNSLAWVAATNPVVPVAINAFKFRGNISPSFYQQIAAFAPYLCAAYFAGLVLNTVKLGWEWSKIKAMKRSLTEAEQMQQFINSFSKKLAIARRIQLKFSHAVDVPCVIGWLKPIIILPVTLSVNLSACEIESILLHELAHIKRHDYLANLLQQVISVILFFNPFIYFINHLINRERENSCDDLVIEKNGKPLIYARALLKLEQSRSTNLQLALAATGKKFQLLNRIERIMKTQKQTGNTRHLVAGLLLLLSGFACLAWLNPAFAKNISIKRSKTAIATDTLSYAEHPADTVKRLHKISRVKTTHIKPYHHVVKKSVTGDDTTWSGSIDAYCHSPEWKAQVEAMKKQGEEIKKRFNSPEWKKQMLAMQEQGEEMKKQFDSPEWKKQMEGMRKQGEEMKKQFDSPEWRKQMEDMREQGERIKKQFDSPEWKKQMEDMRRQGEQMKKQFDSPEWKKQMEDMREQGERIEKQFDSPEWKKQMDDMRKQGEEMRKEFDSPEWRKQKWVKKDSTGGVEIYNPAEKDTIK